MFTIIVSELRYAFLKEWFWSSDIETVSIIGNIILPATTN